MNKYTSWILVVSLAVNLLVRIFPMENTKWLVLTESCQLMGITS